MKKISRIIAILVICCLLLPACASVKNGKKPTTTSLQSTTGTTVGDNTGIGGAVGSWDMTQQYLHNFWIDLWLVETLDATEYETWAEAFEGIGKNWTRSVNEFNKYTLIREFAIPRDKVEKVCRAYADLAEGTYLTDEQVEAIYNGTEEEVYRLFANPYAVMVGKQAYSPQWMVEHKAEEYLEVGITHDILTAEFEQLLVPCTEEQRAYLRTQLQALAELDN